MRISRSTILRILKALTEPAGAFVNPQEFAAAAAAQIRRTLVALVASGIV